MTAVADDQMAQEQALLEDKRYYNLTNEKAHEILATQSQITPVFEIVITIASGFLFEIVGRKYLMYYSILLGALSLIFFPIMAPMKTLYISSSIIWTVAI